MAKGEKSGELSPIEQAARWGGLGIILLAIGAAVLQLPGAEAIAPWLLLLGLGCYVAMSVIAGRRALQRRSAAKNER